MSQSYLTDYRFTPGLYETTLLPSFRYECTQCDQREVDLYVEIYHRAPFLKR